MTTEFRAALIARARELPDCAWRDELIFALGKDALSAATSPKPSPAVVAEAREAASMARKTINRRAPAGFDASACDPLIRRLVTIIETLCEALEGQSDGR